MIALKLDSKLSGNATVSLHDLSSVLFHKPDMRIVGVVELAPVERAIPAPGEDKDPTVKVAIKAIEIGRGEQEHHLRQAMDALYRHRTATGTIDDELRPQLSQRTVELTGGVLDAVEAARLRTVCEQWGQYIDNITRGKMTGPQALDELRIIRKGLAAAIEWSV